jgi:tetratricopeptide (TPR) repeat protein
MAKTNKTNKKTGVKKQTLAWPWLQDFKKISLALFALSVLIYANTFNHDFAQDDAIVITDNMFTKEGVAGIPDLFRYDTFYGFFKKANKDKLVAGGRYRPLTPAMFAIEYQLFGLNPAAMHILNALWYGLLVVVLYGALLALFLRRAKWDKGLSVNMVYLIPLLAAFVYAMHPLHTEAVANIKGRDEIMTLLGSIAALWLVLKDDVRYLALAALCFFLALMAKENAITFLGVIPLALYFFTEDELGDIVKKMLPLVGAAALFLVIRFSILGMSFGDPGIELMNNPFVKIEQGRWVDFTAGEKTATITYTLGKYAQLLVAPIGLTHDYYPRQVDIMNWGDWRVLLSLLLYLGLIFYALRGLINKDIGSFAVLFYLLTLSIVSNIVFPVGTNMSERFMFMPSVGFALLISWAIMKYIPQLKISTGVLAGIGLAFAVLTIQRNPAWKDNYTLFTTDIHNSPNSAKLRNAVAGELSVQWAALAPEQQATQTSMLEEALGHINEAIRIHPTYKQAHYIKGNVLYYLKRYDDAIKAYLEALRVAPDYTEAHQNLMITYRDAGRYYGEQQGNIQAALGYLQQAYEGLPEDYETIRLYGVANGIAGNVNKAVELFVKNTQLQPNNARAWYDLGTAYMNAGQQEAAMQALAKAKAIDPNIEQTVRGQ